LSPPGQQLAFLLRRILVSTERGGSLLDILMQSMRKPLWPRLLDSLCDGDQVSIIAVGQTT
jgi:hypothetical protein